jgi:hypothetical protein
MGIKRLRGIILLIVLTLAFAACADTGANHNTKAGKEISAMEENRDILLENLKIREQAAQNIAEVLSSLDVGKIEQFIEIRRVEDGGYMVVTVEDSAKREYCLTLGLDGTFGTVRKNNLKGEVLYSEMD